MAKGLNRVELIGHLGRDPESKSLSSGTSVANFSIATTEKWKDQSGEWVDRTEWHRCVAWAKLADVITQYLRKGSKVFVEGKLQTRKWQDREGQDRYTTEIVVNKMLMLDKKGDAPAGSGTQQSAPQSGQRDDEFDDDIPF